MSLTQKNILLGMHNAKQNIGHGEIEPKVVHHSGVAGGDFVSKESFFPRGEASTAVFVHVVVTNSTNTIIQI